MWIVYMIIYVFVCVCMRVGIMYASIIGLYPGDIYIIHAFVHAPTQALMWSFTMWACLHRS